MANNQTYAAPLTELIARLEFSIATGQLLDGWRFKEMPEAEVQGLKDFPVIVLSDVSIEETYRPGHFIVAQMTLTLIVCTKRTEGFPDHFEKLARVLNAIQLNRSTPRLVDAGLAGTIWKVMGAPRTQMSVLDLSLQSKITVVIDPKVFEVGKR